MKEETTKKQKILKKLKRLTKIVKPIHLVFLVLILATNTFAWFIYITRVSTAIDVHVSTWKIQLKDEDDRVVDYVNFSVDEMQPGMDDFTDSLEITNYGEVDAELEYQILSVKMLGEEIKTIEGKEETGEETLDTDISSEEMIEKLQTDYPFVITFSKSDEVVESHGGTTQFSSLVVWPYESGNDELDTYWGVKSAEYKDAYRDYPTIEIEVKVTISQSKK